MNNYVEFPLVMNHPHYQPATHMTEARDPNLPGAYKPTTIGTPAKLPPVTVHNADQEAEHAAKGYVRAGVGDPAAYHAMVSGAPPPDREFHVFPKWKYHVTKEALIVKTPEEERALGAGWNDRPGGYHGTIEVAVERAPVAEEVPPKPARTQSKPKTRKRKKVSAATREKIRATLKARYAQTSGA